jgi:hypothetical protein
MIDKWYILAIVALIATLMMFRYEPAGHLNSIPVVLDHFTGKLIIPSIQIKNRTSKDKPVTIPNDQDKPVTIPNDPLATPSN